MKQSIKAKRNIGLIVLTVLVVVAIVLVIYFVQKADLDGRIKKGAIGQTLSAKSADVCVSDMNISQSVGGETAADGKCFFVLTIKFDAKKDMTVVPDKFEVKGGRRILHGADGYLNEKAALKKGESKTFKLVYEVENNRVDSYFLYGYGVQIDLGGTVIFGS